MLTIRLQRVGRKKLAQYRVIVQDSRYSPTSGKVVEYLGSFDPHAKSMTLDKEKAEKFMSNGAQPSERVARLFKSEGVTLPKWVKITDTQTRTVKNTEKLRKHRPPEEKAPEEPVAEAPAEAKAEEEKPVEDVAVADAPAEEVAPEAETKEEPAAEAEKTEEAPAEEKAEEEKPAENAKEEKTDAQLSIKSSQTRPPSVGEFFYTDMLDFVVS